MDKITPKDVFQANRDRAAPLLKQLRADGIGHIIDGKVVPSISGDSLRDQIADRWRGARDRRARRRRRYRPRRDGSGKGLQGLARHAGDDAQEAAASRRRRHRGRAPTISRCSNASTPARPTASWPRPRSAARKISASSPTDAPRRATASTRPATSTGTSRPGCRSARSASSRRGIRRSCCRPGRSRRRSPPAARWCTSRRNGRRSPPTCWRDW